MKKIAVIGLGYVGLPLAREFSNHFPVIGFDISENKVKKLKSTLESSCRSLTFTTDESDIKTANFYIIAVPTDINFDNTPELLPLKIASATVGQFLKKGDIVVYESTVYPGCTEEICIPNLEKYSGLYEGDFVVGYSPERINPGDKKHTLTNIKKIVSCNSSTGLQKIVDVYSTIIKAGLFEVQNIKVAEAAKITENIQRDINISLMNELSIIFDRIGIDTRDVIKAASTKWNFHKYYPGLVGGHCIGVDPYYLIYKSKQLGYNPRVIGAGRSVNNYIPVFVAQKLKQELIGKGKTLKDCKVLVLGITFKENVSDIRNSKVVDLVRELEKDSINIHVRDFWASPEEVKSIYGINLVTDIYPDYDAVIVAVAHDDYKLLTERAFLSILKKDHVFFDLKGIYDFKKIKTWRL